MAVHSLAVTMVKTGTAGEAHRQAVLKRGRRLSLYMIR